MNARDKLLKDIEENYDQYAFEPGPDWARSARYLPRKRSLRIELRSGAALEIPIHLIQGMSDRSPRERATLELSADGYSIHWPLIDEDMIVPNLCAGMFGNRTWMQELARRGGSVKSARKAAAARKNGKKGGRPRSTQSFGAPKSKGKVPADASKARRSKRNKDARTAP